MITYIAILRGVNVGGKNKLPMADLRNILEKSGYKHVRTYIQSGNIVFETEEADKKELANKIAGEIYAHWRYGVPVIVLSRSEFSEIINANPFMDTKDVNCQHITFLGSIPDQHLIDSIKAYQDPPNEFRITNSAVYLVCPNGYSKTKLTNNFMEAKLKVSATTRNLKTSRVLQNMAW